MDGLFQAANDVCYTNVLICRRNVSAADTWCCCFIMSGCDIALLRCRSDDSANATDNAVSALGKVIEHRQDCLDGTPLVATWLSHLPIRHDLTEAHAAHAQLLRLLEKSDPRCASRLRFKL